MVIERNHTSQAKNNSANSPDRPPQSKALIAALRILRGTANRPSPLVANRRSAGGLRSRNAGNVTEIATKSRDTARLPTSPLSSTLRIVAAALNNQEGGGLVFFYEIFLNGCFFWFSVVYCGCGFVGFVFSGGVCCGGCSFVPCFGCCSVGFSAVVLGVVSFAFAVVFFCGVFGRCFCFGLLCCVVSCGAFSWFWFCGAVGLFVPFSLGVLFGGVLVFVSSCGGVVVVVVPLLCSGFSSCGRSPCLGFFFGRVSFFGFAVLVVLCRCVFCSVPALGCWSLVGSWFCSVACSVVAFRFFRGLVSAGLFFWGKTRGLGHTTETLQ